jgi:hypothetical protein
MPTCENRGLAKVWPSAVTTSLPDAEFERLVADVTADLIAGHDAALRAMFERIESPTPMVMWEPDATTLEAHPHLAFLQRYWSERRRDADLPLSSGIDAIDLAPVLGHVMLMEPVDGGDDFLYRVYGTLIAQQAGMEMTGKRVRDIPAPLVAVYFLATYRAVMQGRRPMFAHHSTHHDIQIAEWDRLILPFVNDEGMVDRLLVGNVSRFRPRHWHL